jgi:chemotaxis protein CheZ
MSDAAADRDLAARLGRAETEIQTLPSVEGIAEIVEGIMSTMTGDLSPANIRIHTEIEALARYIADARQEIASLRPDEIREQHLQTASDELDAIVEATEHATNGILEAAETIESLIGELEPGLAERLTETVTKIYESCNFQDITGQRITKVVKALKHIEAKVDGLQRAFGGGAAAAAAPAASEAVADPDAALLSGPQLPANARSQDDIDRLFSGGA